MIDNFEKALVGAKTINERIKWLLKLKNTTRKELATACGVSKASVSTLTTGRIANVSAPTLFLMAHFFDVDAEWLLTGNGSYKRRTDKELEHAEKLTAGIQQALSGQLSEFGLEAIKSKSVFDGEFAFVNFRMLRILNVKSEDCSVVDIAGDEMNPVIYDGDSVVIHDYKENSALKNGKIYAIQSILTGAIVCRRLLVKITTSEILMSCEDNAYPSEIFDSSKLKILGRVLAVRNRILND